MRRSLLAAALLAMLSGCGPFWVNPYIAVKESPLNWVNIHYYNMSKKPIHRISVYITGDGYVEVKKGTSDLISNDFAKKYRDDNWGDVKLKRLKISPEDVNNILQNLVNHGVLDKEKTGKKSKKESFSRFIAVKANISNNTYSDNVNIFEEDPDLAEQLLDVIREFDSPTL